MNRAIGIPLLLAVAMFATWLFMNPKSTEVKRSAEPSRPDNPLRVTGESKRLPVAESTENESSLVAARLVDRWNSANEQKKTLRLFSRAGYDADPFEKATAIASFPQAWQPNQSMLLGEFTLTVNDSRFVFPILFDPTTETASVFDDHRWLNFEHWIASRNLSQNKYQVIEQHKVRVEGTSK